VTAPARRASSGALWGASALALLLAAAFLAVTHLAPPPCLFKSLTGLPCAACGGTRAALALARLDVASALRWNPLAAVALPAFVVLGLGAGLLWLLGREVPDPRPPLPLRVLGLAALAANWVYLLAAGR